MKIKPKIRQPKRNEIPAPKNAGAKRRPALHTVMRLALPLAVFCWPVLYLYDHVFVINGQYLAIINDFIMLYYKYKIYLLDCLANAHFPLWSPSEAAGFPFYTNPFTQIFYPFNVLLLAWYKNLGGYSALDHQLFTVLGISIFALGLYAWLKTINKNTTAVLFSVLIMSASFKITELVRFPNAVHSAAWYPWLLYAMTRIMFSNSAKESAKEAGLLVFFSVCLCTAGYPYFLYYTIFLVFPYVLAFLIKPLREGLFGPRPFSLKRAFTTLAVAGFVTLTLCGPYLLGIKQLMSRTIDRAGKDYEYSVNHIFNFEDTVGSLVYPPGSSTEGWYFFSVTALLIIMLYLLGRRAVSVNKDNEYPGGLWVKLFFVLWFGLITYITWGKYSYLFTLLWNYMPGFSSLRVWGRLNIILVPILAWLLSTAYSHFAATLRDNSGSGLRRLSGVLVTVTGVYLVVLGSQLYLHLSGVRDPMWVQYFVGQKANEPLFIIFGAAAFAAILVIIIFGARVPFGGRQMATATAILVLLAIVEMHHTGAKMWTRRSDMIPQRFQLNVAKLDAMSFGFARTDVNNSIPLSPRFNIGTLPNWYFARYVSFLKRTENEAQPRNILLGIADGTKIFFSESIEYPNIESFLRDALRYRQTGRLISYNGDELQWEIDAPKAGFLSFIDNWDRGWKAWVDEQPAKIELLFGTFKAVQLTQGRHKVRFIYQPGLLPAVTREKGS